MKVAKELDRMARWSADVADDWESCYTLEEGAELLRAFAEGSAG